MRAVGHVPSPRIIPGKMDRVSAGFRMRSAGWGANKACDRGVRDLPGLALRPSWDREGSNRDRTGRIWVQFSVAHRTPRPAQTWTDSTLDLVAGATCTRNFCGSGTQIRKSASLRHPFGWDARYGKNKALLPIDAEGRSHNQKIRRKC
jgi:hypothetical protein